MTVQNNQWINEEITREIRQYFEMNENKNTTHQILRDTTKVALRGKFIAVIIYINKEQSSQIDNWSFHLDKLEKEEQTKPKATREKEMIKIKVEINHKIENINETKNWFFEKISKIDKLLGSLARKKGRRCKLVKSRRKEGTSLRTSQK